MYSLPLLTGAAFVAAGAVLAAEARVIDAGLPVPRDALALLGAFAIANGLSEWADMAMDVEELARGAAPPALLALDLLCLTASFAALLGFAFALRRAVRWRSAFVALAAVAVVGWTIALAAWLHANPDASPAEAYDAVEALTRWVLGLPACVCAAAGLIGLAPRLELEDWVMARLVRSAGLVLLLYGSVAAVMVLPDRLGPAWPFSPRDFGQHLGVTVEVVRAVCGAAIAICLSEAFVFQTSQRLRREETHLRDDFVALVTHELGNPVAALQLAAERLEASRRASGPVDARLAQDVRACAGTLRRIVMDLLDTSRIHARNLEITPEALELAPVVARAAELSSTCAAAAPAVEVSCPPDLRAQADPARLDQILRNLLSNAAKYSRPGSPIALEAVRRGDEVVVRVINEGPRIAPREVSRIFSQHYRAPGTARDAEGRGLGLYVARGLVEAHGGRIWVERQDERTAFCFTVPWGGLVPAGPEGDGSGDRAGGATGTGTA